MIGPATGTYHLFPFEQRVIDLKTSSLRKKWCISATGKQWLRPRLYA